MTRTSLSTMAVALGSLLSAAETLQFSGQLLPSQPPNPNPFPPNQGQAAQSCLQDRAGSSFQLKRNSPFSPNLHSNELRAG